MSQRENIFNIYYHIFNIYYHILNIYYHLLMDFISFMSDQLGLEELLPHIEKIPRNYDCTVAND